MLKQTTEAIDGVRTHDWHSDGGAAAADDDDDDDDVDDDDDDDDDHHHHHHHRQQKQNQCKSVHLQCTAGGTSINVAARVVEATVHVVLSTVSTFIPDRKQWLLI